MTASTSQQTKCTTKANKKATVLMITWFTPTIQATNASLVNKLDVVQRHMRGLQICNGGCRSLRFIHSSSLHKLGGCT